MIVDKMMMVTTMTMVTKITKAKMMMVAKMTMVTKMTKAKMMMVTKIMVTKMRMVTKMMVTKNDDDQDDCHLPNNNKGADHSVEIKFSSRKPTQDITHQV